MTPSEPARPSPSTEPWWMIERDDLNADNYLGGRRPMYLCWLHEPGSKHFPRGQHSWTPDWQRGAKFATKEAAEEHTNGDPLLFVRDHCMMATVTDEGLVEVAANAIRDLTGGENYDYMDFCRDAARAALEASGHTALLREIEVLREHITALIGLVDANSMPLSKDEYRYVQAARAALSRPLDERE